MSFKCQKLVAIILLSLAQYGLLSDALSTSSERGNTTSYGRARINIDNGWRFFRSESNPDGLSYDTRPGLPSTSDTESLKLWILPCGNRFIKDVAQKHDRPTSNPKSNVSFAQNSFDDTAWETINLPHDWAIKGPFYVGDNVPVTGGMGRLPVYGVGWYRRKIEILSEDRGKFIYLDIDGAMSYAMVWLNGNLVGGWPYPYNSFRLDLTPYLVPGDENILAIRLDNPTQSSRWYPGGGLYRHVWLTKAEPVHVAQWGTYITSRDVSAESATIDAVIQIDNNANSSKEIEVATDVYILEGHERRKVAFFPVARLVLPASATEQINGSVEVKNPQLWGPPPTQFPHLYVAVTRINFNNKTIDTYETNFGIRSLVFNSEKGLLINDEHVRIQGVNQHHDLGALGAAFNTRAAERQLEVLRDMGCNAIRMSHNPPAPELLALTDRMGFLVIDEVFDMWERQKTPADYHLLFTDWHEPDLRAFLRRDRNHPSIVAWSFGNEVGEQTTGESGAVLATRLRNIVHEEDPTRPGTASMNAAEPNMPFPQALDILSLNYQGEGFRDTPAYSHLPGRKTKPLYADFHEAFPENMLLSSETAATLSMRGAYIFPVTREISAPVNDTSGGNSTSFQVSAYELHTADFGSSPDKVFPTQDKNPYVAGEFVWSGWDYLGEPTPYYSARSSYFGIVDLAGFKKDRFFLYQSRWRPDLKMAHILPHWTWPDRAGQTTPVHVFSAADEAELFLNGKSQGRKKKQEYEYRFRWDDVKYQSGELHVVAYKNGTKWAEETTRTAGESTGLDVTADRTTIRADGVDLSFITVKVVDSQGNTVPHAADNITLSISGPGEIVATDNGNPVDFTSFSSKERKAFNGLALAIIRTTDRTVGQIKVVATAKGLETAQIVLEAQ
ncbi:glycoside hydrolase family 2 protein [Aaosphaeria arxii CBS 175.79]|uniref:Glycoside hydrolase family 2 protein n=1 Tax=Aaosphaeria arxii CBS 175.79 TaxID=1450172 RepID=A0A6A5X7A6_9PLEO|nr:glycoside hydrolase family 2 protein [Aaosphaeria arxii CBS 175.79]KAF2008802.1 glycoside hydrolase family 2 protein [Aaosphaeria arxii CBS 175.79]